ncbi:hypothetical protein OH492_19840 [Vibrio chagasii]|nr:hypothetical protein [Vibrio chagasii]
MADNTLVLFMTEIKKALVIGVIGRHTYSVPSAETSFQHRLVRPPVRLRLHYWRLRKRPSSEIKLYQEASPQTKKNYIAHSL